MALFCSRHTKKSCFHCGQQLFLYIFSILSSIAASYYGRRIISYVWHLYSMTTTAGVAYNPDR